MQTTKMIWRRSTLIRAVEFPIPQNHLASGVVYRLKNQAPVLAGLGCSVRDIVGSVRQLRTDRGKVHGVLRWCDDSAAAIVREKFETGILRLRLETSELAVCNLQHGEEFLGFRGPMNVVFEWELTAVRLVGNSGANEGDTRTKH